MTDYGMYITIATLGLPVLAYAVKVTLHVSRIEKEQREYTDAQVDNLQRDIGALTATSVERADSIRHEAGEVGAALRTKIHELEVFSRDTFVRKDSFEVIIAKFEKSMEKLGDRVEEKLEKFWERAQRS